MKEIKCKKCGDYKLEGFFYKSKTNKSGRQGSCIICYKKATAERTKKYREDPKWIKNKSIQNKLYKQKYKERNEKI